MSRGCDAPITDETLLDYWSGDLDTEAADSLETHLFACGDCASRLEGLAALAAAIATAARRGNVLGIIPRALLNRLQRDGVHVRLYSLFPAETVPCAVFAGDDVVVASLRADLTGVPAVTLSVTGPGDVRIGEAVQVPVSQPEGEVLWATPGWWVRQMPSSRLQLTLTAAGGSGRVLGEYFLDHTALEPPI